MPSQRYHFMESVIWRRKDLILSFRQVRRLPLQRLADRSVMARRVRGVVVPVVMMVAIAVMPVIVIVMHG